VISLSNFDASIHISKAHGVEHNRTFEANVQQNNQVLLKLKSQDALCSDRETMCVPSTPTKREAKRQTSEGEEISSTNKRAKMGNGGFPQASHIPKPKAAAEQGK